MYVTATPFNSTQADRINAEIGDHQFHERLRHAVNLTIQIDRQVAVTGIANQMIELMRKDKVRIDDLQRELEAERRTSAGMAAQLMCERLDTLAGDGRYDAKVWAEYGRTLIERDDCLKFEREAESRFFGSSRAYDEDEL